MKWEDWKKLDDYLANALENLQMAYEEIDTSSDESWSLDFNETLEKVRCLKEEIIFTFKIED